MGEESREGSKRMKEDRWNKRQRKEIKMRGKRGCIFLDLIHCIHSSICQGYVPPKRGAALARHTMMGLRELTHSRSPLQYAYVVYWWDCSTDSFPCHGRTFHTNPIYGRESLAIGWRFPHIKGQEKKKEKNCFPQSARDEDAVMRMKEAANGWVIGVKDI